MQPSRPPPIPVRFGPFEVDLAATELRKRGRKVPLQDQPFKVLALLLQRPGELVTREELQRSLWPVDTFGEFDEGLNKAIQKLRQALDDSTDKPQFIETLPRKGYRFIAGVESAADGAVAQLAHEFPAKRNREILPWVLFAVAFFLALVLGIAHLRQTPSESYAVRLQVSAPDGVQWESSDYPIVSPNGRHLVFAGVGLDGKRRLWIRSLGSLNAQALPGTEEADILAFWSPDSRFVGFWVGENTKGKLKKIDVMGGLPVAVCDTTTVYVGGTWSRDGIILFSQFVSSGSRLYRVSAAGGEAKPVPQPEKLPPENDMPQFLPDGRHFLYRSLTRPTGAENGAIYLGSLDSKENTLLISGASNVIYEPPGFLIYGRQQSLLAQRFDVEKLRLTGEPFPIAEHVARYQDDNFSLFSASENGVLAYRSGGSGNMQLAWYGRNGARLGPIGERARYGDISLAPDETRLAVRRADIRGLGDIWTMELTSGISTRVTLHPSDDEKPVWSPDGRELVFSSDRKGLLDLYRKVVGGDDEELLFASNNENKFARQWLADGSILFVGESPEGGAIYRLPLSGERKPIPLLKSTFTLGSPIVSPDGGLVAYHTDESGRAEVYIAVFPTFKEKRQVSSDGGYQPLWRKDGKELFYLNREGKLMSVNLKRGVRLETGSPQVLFQAPDRAPEGGPPRYCVTGDGKRFILPEPGEEGKPFTVVLNWTAGLKR